VIAVPADSHARIMLPLYVKRLAATWEQTLVGIPSATTPENEKRPPVQMPLHCSASHRYSTSSIEVKALSMY